jgi:hypothetical protein
MILSGGGAFIAVMSAAGFLVVGIMDLLRDSSDLSEAQGPFSLACIAGLIFLLLMPSTILAAIRLMGKSIPEWHFPQLFRVANACFLMVPVLIVIGYFVSGHAALATILLPLLQLAVVAFPLLWMLVTGRRNFPSGSSQHDWGIFSFSVTVTMPLIIVIESVLIVGIIVGVLAIFAVLSPEILQQFSSTLDRLMNASVDRETVLRILRPYLGQPAVIYFLIAITAGVIPLLEELFKPLALWCFAGRPFTPRDGFVGGMICGAAFALIESLGALSSPAPESWAVIAIGRIGTGILHITASGLVGWGMAKAWHEGKYGSLAASYLAAVSLHSLWNISALMTGLRELAQFSPFLIDKFDGYIQASPFILVMLAFLMVSITMKANSQLIPVKPDTPN